MAVFGVVPPEVPVKRDMGSLAPWFRCCVYAALSEPEVADGRPLWLFETLRTEERQKFLYGFGRSYDDGRGRVTNASTALTSWHGFGLAIDIVEKDATPWVAPPEFWTNLGAAAERHGLTWGGRWAKPDRPHLQWGMCPVSPTESDRELLRSSGLRAVWLRYGADV